MLKNFVNEDPCMQYRFPYNEKFVVFGKKHAGGNGNLIINFIWLNVTPIQATNEPIYKVIV